MGYRPVITIITVVYNDADNIEGTINSVLGQSYTHLQYVVIDGGSTDGTLDIIKRYSDCIFRIISEPDNGLYDAMNKGLLAATGDYVLFLNSGDHFFDVDTLKAVVSCGTEETDVFYGECVVTDHAGVIIGSRRLTPPARLNWESLKMGMLVSHQSFLVKRSLAPQYDLSYQFAADFHWVLVSLKKATHIVNTGLIISKFLDGGLTKQNILPGLRERYRIMSDHYGAVSTFFRHFLIGVKFLLFVLKNKRF